MKLRRISGFLGGMALLFACALHAQPPLAATIGTLLADPKIEGAHWGISVTQLDGAPIYALNDDKLFQPASNTKLFTTAAVLAHIPKTTSTTSVDFVGVPVDRVDLAGSPADSGSASGSFYIRSDGDAFLSDQPVPYNAHPSPSQKPTLTQLDVMAADLAAQLKKAGITKIYGGVTTYSAFPWQPYAEGWNSDDLVWGYGAPVTGIVINDNQLELTITAGSSVDAAPAISLAPDFAYYTLENHVATTLAKTPTYIDVVRDGRTLRVNGTIALGAPIDIEQVAIDDPPLYTAMAFKSLLAQHGITVTGEVSAPRTLAPDSRSTRSIVREPLVDTGIVGNESGSYGGGPSQIILETSHTSPSLLNDVIITNKESQNLHAELMLRQLARRFSQTPTFAQGARAVRHFAINAGVKPDDFYFVDGSGLSNYDLATPRAFTQLLRYAATQPWGADYKSSLPIGGVDGTLEKRFTKAPLKGNVFAKTGTLSEDRALSGYVVCASGKTVVFSILVGQHLPGSNADRDVMDKIVAAIAAAN